MNQPTGRTCTTATVSLVFGILSWCAIPLIGALIAIVCGHMARAEIRRSQGALEGDGLAITGLVLGYVHVLVALLALATILLVFGSFLAFFAALAHYHA